MSLYYTGKNGNAKKFVEEMESRGIVEKIRNENGNELYEYFFPKDDPETVLLIDKWTDQDALDHHHSTSMMKDISDLREKYDLNMRAERYISEDNISENDKKFIRS